MDDFAPRLTDTLRTRKELGVEYRGIGVNDIRNAVASSCWNESTQYFINPCEAVGTDDQEILSK